MRVTDERLALCDDAGQGNAVDIHLGRDREADRRVGNGRERDQAVEPAVLQFGIDAPDGGIEGRPGLAGGLARPDHLGELFPTVGEILVEREKGEQLRRCAAEGQVCRHFVELEGQFPEGRHRGHGTLPLQNSARIKIGPNQCRATSNSGETPAVISARQVSIGTEFI